MLIHNEFSDFRTSGSAAVHSAFSNIDMRLCVLSSLNWRVRSARGVPVSCVSCTGSMLAFSIPPAVEVAPTVRLLASSAWCDSGVSRAVLAGGCLSLIGGKLISAERSLSGHGKTRRAGLIATGITLNYIILWLCFCVVCPPLESFSRGSLDF